MSVVESVEKRMMLILLVYEYIYWKGGWNDDGCNGKIKRNWIKNRIFGDTND